MRKAGRNISFDKDFLNKLKNDSNACVYVNTVTYHLALHPFHLTDLNASIREVLNEKIAKYDKKFGGILLGYQNIKLLDSVGAINCDSCFIHGNIQADFYIFNPTVGQVLSGIINKKSKDHVGCLVHKTFNVSLPKPQDCESWIGHSTQIGQEVQFEVIFTDLDGRLPYIKGNILSLVSDDSGFSTSEEPNIKNDRQSQPKVTKFEDSDAEVVNKPKKKKKRKREDEDLCTEINAELEIQSKKKRKREDIIPDVVEDNDTEKRKSKKKKKHKECDSGLLDQTEDIYAEVNKKLKKKKHKGDEVLSEQINANLDTPKSKKKKHKL